MSKVQPIYGQSLLDIAAQRTGTVENVISIATENGSSITDLPNTAESVAVSIPPSVPDKKTLDYYEARGIVPGTAHKLTAEEGVGYWIIEKDFIVS